MRAVINMNSLTHRTPYGYLSAFSNRHRERATNNEAPEGIPLAITTMVILFRILFTTRLLIPFKAMRLSLAATSVPGSGVVRLPLPTRHGPVRQGRRALGPSTGEVATVGDAHDRDGALA